MESTITTLEALAALYGVPLEASLAKEADRITPDYAALIAASPFAILATTGPRGLDASPRGDFPGFVRVHDERTLLVPDRRGNNRIDSLRNIVAEGRAALLFLIPGVGITLRVSGRASITTDPPLLASFAVEAAAPRSVIVIAVERTYYQCARAIVRSELWDVSHHRDPESLPSPGTILANLTANRIGGERYDRAWPARASETMW